MEEADIVSVRIAKLLSEKAGVKSTSYDIVKEYAVNVIGTLKRIGSGRKTHYVNADEKKWFFMLTKYN